MRLSRRRFLAASLLPATAAALSPERLLAHWTRRGAPAGARFEPWLELDAAAFRHNVREVARVAGGRPILAVTKNNAYGLGLAAVGPLLDALPEIAGLAVVKPDEAVALRDAGVRKPILVLALAEAGEAAELVARGIELTVYDDGAAARIAEIGRRLRTRVPVHVEIDTGMSRLGIPDHRALPWLADLAARPEAKLQGMFMTFTETGDFDTEQFARFLRVAGAARARGIDTGRLHTVSSHALFFRGENALLDMVRPGLALYGAYPAGAAATARAQLRPAFRLRARVVRVERLRPGDTVSYGRNYTAERPVWIATLPVGHADGYPRNAVKGAEVLIGTRTYRVIGAVSASHTILEIGDEQSVEIGDVATLIGPDHPAILPNTLAERAGISVYDVLMHLSARLPVEIQGQGQGQGQEQGQGQGQGQEVLL